MQIDCLKHFQTTQKVSLSACITFMLFNQDKYHTGKMPCCYNIATGSFKKENLWKETLVVKPQIFEQ